MTVHRPHPIVGPWPFTPREGVEHAGGVDLIEREPDEGSLIYDDPDDAILYDGCDRCAEQADRPLLTLDVDRLGRLWQRMVSVERYPSVDEPFYRTAAEGRAAHVCYQIAVMIERTHPAIDPWRWPFTTADDVAMPLDGTMILHDTGPLP